MPRSSRKHPTRIGRYAVVRPLSKGGMAYVYEGRRESLEGVSPRVAIKVILPEHQTSDTFRDLFVNEARLGASMEHQNLVQIQDFGKEGDTWYLVMEFVEGLTLRKILAECERRHIAIPMHVIAEIGRQACNGLHYAHRATDAQGRPLRLIHRDIKPSNLILGPHGVVKVLDFGISKGVLHRERVGSVKGTWGYMAPEQAQGLDVRPEADVFGLATVLYELAARRPMFTDQPKEEIKRLLFDDHAARKVAMLDGHLYGRLIGVLVRALQRDPAARYPTAEAFGEALSGLLTDPITDRDRLMAFFERMEDPASDSEGDVVLEPVTAVPEVAVPPPVRPRSEGSRGALMFVAGAVLSVLGTLSLLALGTWAVGQMGQVAGRQVANEDVVADEQVVAVAPTLPLAWDEPSGPAGKGAPGERRPPPIDARRVPVTTGASEGVAAFPDVEPPELPDPIVPVRGEATESAPGPAPPTEAEPESELAVVGLGAHPRAEVYVGQEYWGVTPQRRALPADTHDVRLILPNGHEKAFTVSLSPGKEVTKVWDFERTEWKVDRERDREE